MADYRVRSNVDPDGERWINLNDLLEGLRDQPDPAGSLARLADNLKRYAADMDAELKAGRVGRNRLQVVSDDKRDQRP